MLDTSRGPISISTPWSGPNSQHNCRTPTSQHHGLNSTSQLYGRTPILNIMVGTQLRQPASIADSPTACLPGSKSTPNSLFQNLQILRTIASGHNVIHTPAAFPIWSLLWQLGLSYPLCTSVKLYPMSVHLN